MPCICYKTEVGICHYCRRDMSAAQLANSSNVNRDRYPDDRPSMAEVADESDGQ